MKTPERYIGAKWEDVPAAIRASVEMMQATGKGIYIHGAVGTGKTHIAYAIKHHIEAQPGGWLLFWNVTDLLHEVRADFNRDGNDKRQPDQALVDQSIGGTKYLAILDDIGAEKPSEFVSETLYLIINGRYNKMLPTIFTSNCDLGQLAERIGERNASRIAEMCEIVNLTGADRRLT